MVGDNEEGIRGQFSQAVDVLRGANVNAGEYRPTDHNPLARFDDATGREVKRYRLDAPYAFAVITDDEMKNEHRCHLAEPALDGFRGELL
jgi:flagellar protein FlaI